MLTILAGVATEEREIMPERQREGIATAKGEGKYKGRPVGIDAATVKKAIADGETPTAVTRRLDVAGGGGLERPWRGACQAYT